MKVRSRAGFFGMPGGQARRIVSARRRMLADLNSPLRDEDIAVDLTASFQISNALGPHIESLLHVSPQNIDFRPDDRGCRVAHIEVAILPQQLGADFKPAAGHSQLNTITACGHTAEAISRDGLVFTARQKIDTAGGYQMHAVVRNVPPGEGATMQPGGLLSRSDPDAPAPAVHIGSASEFVNVPDLHAGPTLSGIGLHLASVQEPSDGNPSWRPPLPGDPAIRNFHAGDVIAYRASLAGRSGKAPTSAQLKILFEGKPIHSEAIVPEGGLFHGSYAIDASAPPGQYLLGIVLTTNSRKGTAAAEWVNFQVTR